MRPAEALFISVVAVSLCCAGCWKKSGAAVVTGKDYVPARAISETPNEVPAANPAEDAARPAEAPTSSKQVSADEAEEEGAGLTDMIRSAAGRARS